MDLFPISVPNSHINSSDLRDTYISRCFGGAHKTAKTKGSEEYFPWRDDVRDGVHSKLEKKRKKKKTWQVVLDKNGLSGLGPTAGSGYLVTPKLAGLGDE